MADERPTCSAKACRAAATTALRWNNPRLHTEDRRKVWLACPDHEDSLSQFLSARGFLRDHVTMDQLADTSDVVPR